MFQELRLSVKLAIRNLRTNIGRTVLTLFGIVIGITSVIVIMSSGQGVKKYILDLVGTFGNDAIQVEVKVPATGKTSSQNALGQAMGIQITTLNERDAITLAKLPNVAAFYSANFTQEITSFGSIKKRTLLFGTSEDVPAVDPGVKIAEGSFFTASDDRSLAQVVVIGPDIKQTLFGDANAVGQEIKIKNKNYKVIGVLGARGAFGPVNYDELVYLPVKTLQKKILGIDYLRNVFVKVKDQSLLDVTVADITDTLRRNHDITDPDKDDFSVTSLKEVQDIIGTVFNTINILLLALTSISLIVGGVGIMNVMYVSVVERTFEIGLRKAVGAKSGDILKQFLLEAIFVTGAGGIVGIILGFLLLFVLSLVFARLGFNLSLSVTSQSVLVATGFSVAVGIIFGYYPARSASRLSPMDALRKE
ncbi:FtsX-like permease family protein [Patescibacteria group bacterium]|nr:MAG: FtsX-like permease family protein [Patescibacteria group bacterium]